MAENNIINIDFMYHSQNIYTNSEGRISFYSSCQYLWFGQTST